MNLKSIWQWIITFGGDVLAAIWGSKLAAEDGNKPVGGASPGKILGGYLQEKLAEKLDRGTLLHELHTINADTQGGIQKLMELYLELQVKHVIFVGNQAYTEDELGLMLMQIPVDERSTEYVILNDVLVEQGREALFSQLEILRNNKLQQKLEKFDAVAKKKIGEVAEPIKNAARKNRENKGYVIPSYLE